MDGKCIERQVKVMLLGTYHMGGGGKHVIGENMDNVLSPKRQREIVALVRRLAKWKPEIIAVEFPYEKQNKLDSLYKEYIKNSKDFQISSKNEIVQIGFRLAHYLKHKRLLAVDWFPDLPEWITEKEIEDVMYFTPEAKFWSHEQIEYDNKNRLGKLTISQYLHWLNSKPQVNINDAMMIDISLEHRNKRVAFAIASNWFERNLGIVRNLKEILPEEIERVLLLYGTGHIPMLNYILEMFSIFIPISPLPYLK